MSSEAHETSYEALCAKLIKSSKQTESCTSHVSYIVELLAKRQLYRLKSYKTKNERKKIPPDILNAERRLLSFFRSPQDTYPLGLEY